MKHHSHDFIIRYNDSDSDSGDFNTYFGEKEIESNQSKIKDEESEEEIEIKDPSLIGTPLRKRQRPTNYSLQNKRKKKRLRESPQIDSSDSEHQSSYNISDSEIMINSDEEENVKERQNREYEIVSSSSEEEEEEMVEVKKYKTPESGKRNWLEKIKSPMSSSMAVRTLSTTYQKKGGQEKESEYEILLKKAESSIETEKELLKKTDWERKFKNYFEIIVLLYEEIQGCYLTTSIHIEKDEVIQIWFNKNELDRKYPKIRGIKLGIAEPIRIKEGLYVAYCHKLLSIVPPQTITKYIKMMNMNDITVVDMNIERESYPIIPFEREETKEGNLTKVLLMREKTRFPITLEGKVYHVFENNQVLFQENTTSAHFILQLQKEVACCKTVSLEKVLLYRRIPIFPNHPLYSIVNRQTEYITFGHVTGDIVINDLPSAAIKKSTEYTFEEKQVAGRYSLSNVFILYTYIYSVEEYIILLIRTSSHDYISLKVMNDSIPLKLIHFIDQHPPGDDSLILKASFENVYYNNLEKSFYVDTCTSISNMSYEYNNDDLNDGPLSVKLPHSREDFKPIMPNDVEYYYGCKNRNCLGIFSNQVPFLYEAEDTTPKAHRFSFSSSEICCPKCFETQPVDSNNTYILVASDNHLIDHLAAQYIMNYYKGEMGEDSFLTAFTNIEPHFFISFHGIILTPNHFKVNVLYQTLCNFENNGQTPEFLEKWLKDHF
mmetsp:Transcript_11118/g.16368  ORF Transcript_11118/g.16368 Transcript_11118/m.16368 type:complete len:717 (+) Transcript_11118:75-2225(+)